MITIRTKMVFILFFRFFLSDLIAIDFNNTQAKHSKIDEALLFNYVQNRNDVLYEPNSEVPFTGFIKKVYKNTQIDLMIRVSSGELVEIERWKENGIPIFSVGIIKGSMDLSNIPSGMDALDDKLFNGLTRFWFSNGQIMLESNYKNGKRDGLTRSWYENGNPKVEESYKDGLKDGNAKSWFESGRKWMHYSHWKDKRDGPLTWWYENGQKRQEGNYKGGMRFGEWSYYQEDGKILYRKTFRDGQAISTEYGETSVKN